MTRNSVVVVGSFVQDLAFRSEKLPAPGETRIGTFRTGPGGKGFNQAIACHRQKVPTSFIGACGVDLFATEIKRFIATEGLDARLLDIPHVATGTAAILVDDSAQNSIVVALGANNFLTAQFVTQQRDLFQRAAVVLVQAECNLAATLTALNIGRQGSIAILNPAPINTEISQEILKSADILTPNETEFSFLLKHLFATHFEITPEALDLEELHRKACMLGVPSVVITLGGLGAFVSHNRPACSARLPGAADEPEYYLVPPIEVIPVDTTGAGDAFSGGLAAGLVLYPQQFKRAVQYASSVAGLSTTKVGTAPSMPTKEEVLSL